MITEDSIYDLQSAVIIQSLKIFSAVNVTKLRDKLKHVSTIWMTSLITAHRENNYYEH